MPTFADIQQEISNIMDIPLEQMNEEQTKAWNAYADELGVAQEEKIDGYGQFRRLELASADALEAESKRLAAKAKAKRGNVAWLDNYYMRNMQANGEKKIRGQLYTLSIRKSEAVQVSDLSVLPEKYVTIRTESTPNKTAIKAAIKAGIEVPGASIVHNFSLNVA